MVVKYTTCLETFSVYNIWARLFILFLGDHHLFKSGQRGQDGAPNPGGVLPFWWCNDLHLSPVWSKADHLFLHPLCHPREHGVAPAEDNVGPHVSPVVEVPGLGALVDSLMDTKGIQIPSEVEIMDVITKKQHFWTLKHL